MDPSRDAARAWTKGLAHYTMRKTGSGQLKKAERSFSNLTQQVVAQGNPNWGIPWALANKWLTRACLSMSYRSCGYCATLQVDLRLWEREIPEHGQFAISTLIIHKPIFESAGQIQFDPHCNSRWTLQLLLEVSNLRVIMMKPRK